MQISSLLALTLVLVILPKNTKDNPPPEQSLRGLHPLLPKLLFAVWLRIMTLLITAYEHSAWICLYLGLHPIVFTGFLAYREHSDK